MMNIGEYLMTERYYRFKRSFREFIKDRFRQDAVEVDRGFLDVCKKKCGITIVHAPCMNGKKLLVGRGCPYYAEAVVYSGDDGNGEC